MNYYQLLWLCGTMNYNTQNDKGFEFSKRLRLQTDKPDRSHTRFNLHESLGE
jgi:hypothetical protein